MASVEDVTVTLPESVVQEMEILRRSEQFRRSLENPHPDSGAAQDSVAFEKWMRGLPEEDLESLVDPGAARAVRWIPGEGWAEAGDR